VISSRITASSEYITSRDSIIIPLRTEIGESAGAAVLRAGESVMSSLQCFMPNLRGDIQVFGDEINSIDSSVQSFLRVMKTKELLR
jgi:hypothetical protein